MQRLTQKDRVLRHLSDYGKITSMEAFVDYGITRLSAVIFDLRALGYNIISENTEGVNRYNEKVYFATYKLEV